MGFRAPSFPNTRSNNYAWLSRHFKHRTLGTNTTYVTISHLPVFCTHLSLRLMGRSSFINLRLFDLQLMVITGQTTTNLMKNLTFCFISLEYICLKLYFLPWHIHFPPRMSVILQIKPAKADFEGLCSPSSVSLITSTIYQVGFECRWGQLNACIYSHVLLNAYSGPQPDCCADSAKHHKENSQFPSNKGSRFYYVYHYKLSFTVRCISLYRNVIINSTCSKGCGKFNMKWHFLLLGQSAR